VRPADAAWGRRGLAEVVGETCPKEQRQLHRRERLRRGRDDPSDVQTPRPPQVSWLELGSSSSYSSGSDREPPQRTAVAPRPVERASGRPVRRSPSKPTRVYAWEHAVTVQRDPDAPGAVPARPELSCARGHDLLNLSDDHDHGLELDVDIRDDIEDDIRDDEGDIRGDGDDIDRHGRDGVFVHQLP